jgi:lipopolysaccharide biosynthesis protein
MIRRSIVRGFRYLRRQTKAGLKLSYGFLTHLASYLDFRKSVLASYPGAAESSKSVAIFSHYDRNGRVRGYVRHHLKQIRAAGFDIIFVTNGGILLPESIEWLRKECRLIVWRRNLGFDFGGYKEGIAAIPNLGDLDSLLLVNDSVYGPFHDLGSVINKMSFDEADAWGITDSWERRYHLQSFFILLGPVALAHPGFTRFWRDVRNVRSKYWVVRKYEIGLSRRLVLSGLRCKALCPARFPAQSLIREVRQQRILDVSPTESPTLSNHERHYMEMIFNVVGRGRPINASHFFWEYLVSSMGCPFLKRDLLRRNPGNVPFLTEWERVVSEVSSYDTELIVEDLQYSLKNRSV